MSFENPQNEDNSFRKKSSVFFADNKRRTIAIVLLAILLASLLVGCCVGFYFLGYNNKKNLLDELAVANEVYNMIDKYYYQDISREEFDFYASLGLSQVMDQYSGLSLTQGEISPTIGIRIKSDSYNNHLITDIVKGSPADRAVGVLVDDKGNEISNSENVEIKLERGDLLYNVDGKIVQGLNSTALNSADFLGKIQFDLIVKKSNDTFAKFHIKKVYMLSDTQAQYMDLGDGIGYIDLNSFTGSAAEDFVACANQFNARGNEKLILDLRDNGGGSSNILQVIASYLLHDSEKNSNNLPIMKIISAKSTNPIKDTNTYYTQGDNWLGKGKQNYKLVVLVNENSASASEALLGAIKYYCPEATIIGSPTYGKGIAQQTFKLQSADLLLSMTIGNFYVPVMENGKQNWATFHKIPMTPTAGYEIPKFSAYDMTTNNYYKDYYNNDITHENAVKMALEILK